MLNTDYKVGEAIVPRGLQEEIAQIVNEEDEHIEEKEDSSSDEENYFWYFFIYSLFLGCFR